MTSNRPPQRLGLGTVQFGLDYGIANQSGRVALADAVAIVALAGGNGLEVLDTASAYGDSESTVGLCLLANAACAFRVVTKTAPLGTAALGAAELQMVERAFMASLERLGRRRVDCLMVHHADDLLVPGGERLFARLLAWREQGLVDKIGVSVYDKEQIERLFARYSFDLVQLPLNVFDQRLLHNGGLAMLAERGVEVHARSLLLQGVLLMSPASLPAHLAALRAPLAALHALARTRGLTPLAAAFGFVKQIKEVAVALVGVLSVAHLGECLDAYRGAPAGDYARFAQDDDSLIDPRRWPASR
ncbi:aryl-alcohol dehydrogenase-like predicted oxidoreductase [Janthinobacterium sp. CG_23.3]|uniref:aldo/keto reductase n=1 Tax=Janthinobacterium sp. CG_23.3 TaxID=3349634 RepID=UPI0038D3AE91